MPESALAEAITGQQLNHPNIIRHFGFGKGNLNYGNNQPEEQVAYNLLQLVQYGEILDYVQFTGKFSEPVCRYYFKQIIDGLAYLHNDIGVCHRDMKLDNILLDANFNIKLADFGFSIPL